MFLKESLAEMHAETFETEVLMCSLRTEIRGTQDCLGS